MQEKVWASSRNHRNPFLKVYITRSAAKAIWKHRLSHNACPPRSINVLNSLRETKHSHSYETEKDLPSLAKGKKISVAEEGKKQSLTKLQRTVSGGAEGVSPRKTCTKHPVAWCLQTDTAAGCHRKSPRPHLAGGEKYWSKAWNKDKVVVNMYSFFHWLFVIDFHIIKDQKQLLWSRGSEHEL